MKISVQSLLMRFCGLNGFEVKPKSLIFRERFGMLRKLLNGITEQELTGHKRVWK
jgi:hypothetical protein